MPSISTAEVRNTDQLVMDRVDCCSFRRGCEFTKNYVALGDMIPAANTVVCRLTASIEVMRRRVEMRELGVSRREYAARVAKLNVILDDVELGDFAATNENRSLTDVALEMLAKAGWVSR